QWTPEARRYHGWLDYVRAEFLGALQKAGKINRKEWRDFFYILGPKPLHTGRKKCRMRIFITWSSGAHGDPENIFGSIADALFESDKYLSGEFDFNAKPGTAGRVDIDIEIGDEECGTDGYRLHPRARLKMAK
ncbi:MAG TPA: hypothetical protein PKG74_03070, partial [Candidatus Colwellbacteria bacterium]|nr:hypothetical protein [Candidatus Colwellbacteria bacterium]